MRSKLYSLLNKFHFVFKIKYTNRLRVLAYHTVPNENAFEKQLLYLKSHYNIISIFDLLEHIQNKKRLPKNPLLITFDDGDITVLENGLPLLKKHDLKSCIFIITNLINTSNDVWIKRVEKQEIKLGKTYSEARQKVNYFKSISNLDRTTQMQNYPEVYKQQLHTTDLKLMENQGMFVGNHTHTHPMLDKCTSQEIVQEIELAFNVFNKLNLKGFDVFAYPNGNVSSLTNDILKNFGIKLIFLFDHKINKSKIDPYCISRIRVDSDTNIQEFSSKVSGVHPFMFHLKN